MSKSVLAVVGDRQTQLESLLKRTRDFLQTTTLESGVCMCGSYTKDHGFGDGHSPVDDLRYCADGLIEEIDKVLAS